MKTIKITDENFLNLKEFGHVVPKDYSKFKVSKEYLVCGLDETDLLKVRCTQNCPVNIKIVD